MFIYTCVMITYGSDGDLMSVKDRVRIEELARFLEDKVI